MGRKNKKGRSVRGGARIYLNTKKMSRMESLFSQIENEGKEEEQQQIEQNNELSLEELYDQNMITRISVQEKDESELDTKAIEQQAKLKVTPGDFVNNDPVAKKLSYCGEVVFEFLNLMDHIDEYLQYITDKVTDADRKRVDLEHNIELKGGNCYQMFCISKILQQALIERRDYKDIEAMLQSISQFASNHSSVINEVRSLNSKLERIIKLQDNRIYYPRSDLQLPVSEEFRNLPPNAQDIVRKNYENRR